eukprot:737418-Pleurochrysis_carterae.AAC.1
MEMDTVGRGAILGSAAASRAWRPRASHFISQARHANAVWQVLSRPRGLRVNDSSGCSVQLIEQTGDTACTPN